MNPIKKAYLRFKHYIISNTLHGTHSPFVYHFLESIVYKKSKPQQSKLEGLIYRISNWDFIDHVYALGATYSEIEALKSSQKDITTTYTNKNEVVSMVYFGSLLSAEEIKNAYNNLKNNINTQSVFVFSTTNSSNENLEVWKYICRDEKNIISIDLFSIGILFFVDSKPKEHFTILY